MRSWPVLMAVMLLFVPPQQALADDGQTGARANDLGVYHTFDEMTAELENLTAAHPNILRMESLGKTYEGRDLWAVKLSDNVSREEAEPNITIMGGIHAGEIIGVEVALYILNSLVENYTTNSTIGWYVNSTQIWFVPMLNPDGHVYYEQGNQWRKNRRPNPGGTYGVDLNRNFGHLWGLEASHNPPDDDYCGPYAFSENETQAVDKLVRDHPPKITLSYHAYGQYILYPWGNTINQEPVDPRLSQIAWNMSFAMPEGRRYLPMFAREMYAASGDTDDYFYMNLSILPFTIELTTSNRPLDSAVPGICADNYGPVLYVLNYTAGAPPAPPPKRSLSIDGPEKFSATYIESIYLDYTLNNTGELPEDVSISLSANNSLWNSSIPMMLSTDRTSLDPGESKPIRVMMLIQWDFPPDILVGFSLNAAADSGVSCTKHFVGMIETIRNTTVFFTTNSTSAVFPDQVVRGNITICNWGNVRETVNVSLVLSDGWFDSQLPGLFEVGPGETRNVSLTIHIPTQLPANSLVLLRITAILADGISLPDFKLGFSIMPWAFARLIIGSYNVTLKEKETVTVPIRIENPGNQWQNSTLELSTDNPSCRLDRTQFNIQPYSNATANLTISGKRGSRSLRLTFNALGIGPIYGQVYYNITANETGTTAPYDWTPLLLFLLILVVLAVGLVLWWRFVEVPAGPRRKDGP